MPWNIVERDNPRKVVHTIDHPVPLTVLPVCTPCATNDHGSHTPRESVNRKRGVWQDAYDCKNMVDAEDQCCCRATRPED